MLDGVEYIIYKETYTMGNFDNESYCLGRDSRRYGGVAGAGLGLGIAGTALGILNGGAGLFNGGWNNGWNNGWGRNGNTCGNGFYGGTGFDISVSEALAERDSCIARLQAEKYADSVGLGVYKYFDGKITEIHKELCDQKVFNATVNGAMGTIASQLKDLQDIVGGITRTAVPSDAICDFNAHNNCNSCTRQAT